MRDDWKSVGFGIYVHWPFCESKCPYCDFNSHVCRAIDQRAWADALCAEITLAARRLPNRRVDTVFFGGGTPSLMSPETVFTIIETIRAAWALSPVAEITLEANPSSIEAGRFAAFAQTGVNRISMGMQALNDKDLHALGRLHTVAQARTAFDIAKRHFDRVSFDLIYARQNQSLRDWQDELREAVTMAVDHLSLYQLTIEPNTAFGALYDKGRLQGLPSNILAADLYQATQDIMADAGMPAYEISNHAREGAQSRHNLIYWRYGDYAGIGPGAHGRITLNHQRIATTAPKSPETWLNAVQTQGTATEQAEIIEPKDQATEYMMMALRLAEGADLTRYAALLGEAVDPVPVKEQIKRGFLRREGDRIIATAQGWMVLNAVLRAILI